MLHDIVMIVTGMYIGLFMAFTVAAWFIYLDHKSKEDRKLTEKFAVCTGHVVETAHEILNK